MADRGDLITTEDFTDLKRWWTAKFPGDPLTVVLAVCLPMAVLSINTLQLHLET